MRHRANAIEAATATNIRDITFTSIVDTEELSPFCFSPVYRDAERQLAAAVCLRPSSDVAYIATLFSNIGLSRAKRRENLCHHRTGSGCADLA
jgi:hypothetical protein